MVKALENHRSDYSKLVDKVLSTSTVCVILIDNELRIKYINRAGVKILGCSEKVVSDITWRELNINSDILDRIENNLRWVFLSGEVVKDTIPAVDGDKDSICEYILIPLNDLLKRNKTVLMAVRELNNGADKSLSENYESKITLLTYREYVKRNRENKTGDIINTMYGCTERTNTQVVLLNNNFNILMANDEFMKSMGRKHKSIVGLNYFDLFPESKRENIFNEVLMTGKPVKVTEETLTYNGSQSNSTICWEWIISPAGNGKEENEGSGDSSGLVVSIQDVTQAVRFKVLNEVIANINTSLRTTYDEEKIIRLATIKAAKALNCSYAYALKKKDNKWFKKCLYGRTGFLNEINKDETADFETSMVLRENGSFLDVKVPLVLRDETIGRLDFVSCLGGAGSYQMLADFASKLAGTVTLALENSQLYEAKQKIADTLQEALLTMPDSLPSVEFCHLYHSASEMARVGGDFYDLFEICRNKVGILIGDVSGKGLEAAALTAVVRNTIRAYAMEGYTPAVVMEKTNDVIRSTTDSISFVTVLFTILDVDTGEIVYCNAGHSAAIIKRENGVDLLEANSPIIGAFDEVEYYDDTNNIYGDVLLLLYTDGVIEARSGGEFYGEDNLVSFIDRLSDKNVKELPKTMFQEIMRFTNGILSDDMALFALALK